MEPSIEEIFYVLNVSIFPLMTYAFVYIKFNSPGANLLFFFDCADMQGS